MENNQVNPWDVPWRLPCPGQRDRSKCEHCEHCTEDIDIDRVPTPGMLCKVDKQWVILTGRVGTDWYKELEYYSNPNGLGRLRCQKAFVDPLLPSLDTLKAHGLGVLDGAQLLPSITTTGSGGEVIRVTVSLTPGIAYHAVFSANGSVKMQRPATLLPCDRQQDELAHQHFYALCDWAGVSRG